MQDRYVGDIGDYFKYGLLRRLAQDRKLGVLWYLFPDENHTADGKHVDYLWEPDEWRDLDPELFDTLKGLVENKQRNVASVAKSEILKNVVFASERLDPLHTRETSQADWRKTWFDNAFTCLGDCEVVFADPDNGLKKDEKYKWGERKEWKSIPVCEVRKLANGRTAIIYHHNTREKGGQIKEIESWIEHLGSETTIALKWSAFGNRTFFILNPTDSIRSEAERFADDWGDKAEFFAP